MAAALAVPAATDMSTASAATPRAALVKEGHVDLFLTSELASALRGAGITPYAVVPTTAMTNWDVPVFRIPLRGGELQRNPYSGNFAGGWLHFDRGGLGFRMGDRRIEFSRFDADLTRGEIRAVVNGEHSSSFPVFTFRVNADQVSFSAPVVSIDGVGLRFTPEAQVLFNAAFGRQVLNGDIDAGNYSARAVLSNS
ncbi:hypothetical protein [Gandjariella thermophila]|uniref:hypothetical protein n=1 Tax=Gandjariella thermophila TaxID=1931992 RepID=UPI0010F7008A|nr:hypothetical protein [Gandjariella thermophila]